MWTGLISVGVLLQFPKMTRRPKLFLFLLFVFRIYMSIVNVRLGLGPNSLFWLQLPGDKGFILRRLTLINYSISAAIPVLAWKGPVKRLRAEKASRRLQEKQFRYGWKLQFLGKMKKFCCVPIIRFISQGKSSLLVRYKTESFQCYEQ
jgi:hypothetical protein